MAYLAVIHDGLVFHSIDALKAHEADCSKCAPFVAAKRADGARFAERVMQSMKAQGLAPFEQFQKRDE